MRGILGNPGTHHACSPGFTWCNGLSSTAWRQGGSSRWFPSCGNDPGRPGSVGSVVIDEGSWYDIGTIESYSRLDRSLPPGCRGVPK